MPARAAEALLDPWWARLVEQDEAGRPSGRSLVAVLSTDFPPGTIVDLPGGQRPPGWQVAVRVAGDAVAAVEVNLPAAPLLWYVELPEADARPTATTVVAFSDPSNPDGAVLGEAQARATGVRGDRQVAALRWWPGTGLVHQLYVRPAHRRRGVAGKLVQAAFGLQAGRGLPPLHGDGRRTDLGELFRRGLPDYAAWRLGAWTDRLPPMTPGERAG